MTQQVSKYLIFWVCSPLYLQSECAELNMGGYLAVQQGSRYSPEFVHMVYKPAVANATKKIVLIGKGLTFDSGGYNLKVIMHHL